MKKAALFVDASMYWKVLASENTKKLLNQFGDCDFASKRFYGNFVRNASIKRRLMRYGIEPVCCAHPATDKIMTNMQLTIDVTEMLYTRHEITTYVLMVGVSNYSALIEELKRLNKEVILICGTDQSDSFYSHMSKQVDEVIDSAYFNPTEYVDEIGAAKPVNISANVFRLTNKHVNYKIDRFKAKQEAKKEVV